MNDPVAVLAHGLWHGGWCWDRVRIALTDLGVDSIAVDLPLTGLHDDVAAVRSAVDGAGRPVVLVGHSYGGAVITEAGAHPLVGELVYLAAYQLDHGESVSRTNFPDLPDTRLPEALRVSGDEVALDPGLGARLLYGDAADDVAADAMARLRPVNRALFRGVPGSVAWRDVPSTNVVCTEDEVVHPRLQLAMAARASRRLDWSCGHSPQATRLSECARLIADRIAALT